jgi:hypothetical protein
MIPEIYLQQHIPAEEDGEQWEIHREILDDWSSDHFQSRVCDAMGEHDFEMCVHTLI